MLQLRLNIMERTLPMSLFNKARVTVEPIYAAPSLDHTAETIEVELGL